MTLQELAGLAGSHPSAVSLYFLAPPALIWLVTRLRGGASPGGTPWRWLYSAALYAVSIPGLLAILMAAEQLIRGGLMQMDLLLHLLPLASLVITLLLFWNLPNPESIPGFRRVSGFLGLFLLTAVAGFLLMRTRIWIMLGGGTGTLLILIGVLLLLFWWAGNRAFSER